MADVYFNKCIYCQDDINGLRIQCCVCEDIVLCLQCFAAGAEFGTHKRNHAYQFADDWPNNIIVKGEGDWTVSEESRLLNNIEVLGFGNWDGVSAIMTNRTPEEIKDHYLSRYLDGVIGRATWAGIQRPDLSKNTDLPISEKKPIVPRLPPLDITLEEAQLLSYMPKRDDFDRETSTDIEAEQLVSSLNGIAIDNEVLDTALKLAQVDMYMRRLRERARRKRIVKDYQLVAKFFASHRKHASKPSYTKEQREFRDRMRIFSQFSTATEHECLISGLEREQELKLRLNELARYRQAGLTHMDECVHYEQHLAFDRRNQTVAPTAITPATHHWKHAKSGSSGFDPYFQEVPQVGRRESVKDSNFIDQKYMYHTEDIYTNENQEILNTTQTTVRPHQEHQQTQLMESSYQMTHTNRDSHSITSISTNDLLPKNELQLCSTLNLHPLQYITLKTVLLKNHFAPESGNGDDNSGGINRTNNNWDPQCVSAVTSYLESKGWLF